MDLCGPSIPRMLRAQGRAVHQCDSGWVPVFVDQEQSISLMSVGFLLESPDEAVVWRGPKKNGNDGAWDGTASPLASPSCHLGTLLKSQKVLRELRAPSPGLLGKARDPRASYLQNGSAAHQAIRPAWELRAGGTLCGCQRPHPSP